MDLIVRARGAPAMEKLALGNRKSPVDYRVLGWRRRGALGLRAWPALGRPGPAVRFLSVRSNQWRDLSPGLLSPGQFSALRKWLGRWFRNLDANQILVMGPQFAL